MSNLGLSGNPQGVFKDGWKKWVEQSPASNLYWRFDLSQWWFGGTTAVRQLPFPAVTLLGGVYPDFIWGLLEGAWKNVKLEHPHALWSPHSGLWYDLDSSAGSGSSTSTKWGPREEALRVELERIDELYNRKAIDAPTRVQMRQAAIEKYERQA